MTLLGYALAAAAKGFYVFPVEPGGKTPGRLYPNRSAEEAPWTVKWSEVSTLHVPTIVQWWNQCPDYNIGIACKPSGLLVVDCDVKNGDGLVEWQEICNKYHGENSWEVWQTYTVNTASGGAHFYYNWPGVQASQSGLSTNVDIRSNGGQRGGYVLASGSVGPKGSYETDNAYPILDAPSWLVELCKERPRPKPIKPRYGQPAPLSFAGLVTQVAMAPEGNRSNALLWAARSMCSDGADESLALELLAPAAVDNGLTEREASDTIRSAYRLQHQKDGR